MKQALYSYLNSLSGVTSVFSAESPDQVRIYPQVLPQDPTYPAATYQVVGKDRQKMFNASNELVRSSVNVDVYGLTSEDVETGSAALRTALKDFQGVMSGVRVNRIWLENEIDLTDLEPGLFRNSMSFTIWHEE